MSTFKNRNSSILRMPNSTPGSDRSPLRVLLAEDDPDMRSLLATALKEDGHDVIEIADGAQFLQVIYSCRRLASGRGFDAIISDIRMPAFSGLEVVADLRSTDTTVPIILITAFGDEQTHAAAFMLGVSAVFDKPFDVDDLRTALLNVVPPRHAPPGHDKDAA
jgi:two-component system response regulator (stage 0 sporulation protein F)